MPEPATMDVPSSVPDINAIFAEIDAQKSDFNTKISELKFEEKGIAPVQPKEPAPEKKSEPAKEAPTKKDIADVPGEARPTEEEIPDTLPEGTDSKKQSQWKQLQTKKKEAEKLVSEYQAKLKDYETKLQNIPKPTPETEVQLLALQKEKDQLSSILESVAAERHPKFQQQFQGRIEAALQLAKQAVGPDLADRVSQLLQMPDNEYRNGQLDSIVSDLGPLRAGKLASAVGEMDRISMEKQHLASKGQEQWKAWTAESVEKQRQQKAQMDAQTEQAFNSEFNEWSSKVPMFQPKENDSKWNEEVQSRVARAKQIFMGKMDEKSLARAAFWAALGQDTISTAKAMEDRCKTLEAENAALKSSAPGSQTASAKTEEIEDTNLSYGEKIAAELRKAGVRFGS